MIIENVSFVGLTDFAPEAKRKEIQKALEKGKIFFVISLVLNQRVLT